MHPSFEQFVAALRDPSLRAGMGLVIGDADAGALLTRQDWAIDYYHKWLALFPVAAELPTDVAATAAEPVSVSAFPTSPAPVLFTAAAPTPVPWFRKPIPRWSRVPLIVVGSVVGAAMLGGYLLGQFHQAIDAAATSRPLIAHSTVAPSSPATGVAVSAGKYGLTGPEYELLDAVLVSENHSVDELVAKGTTDAQLRTLADQVAAKTSTTCADGKGLPNGFDNATFKASFIAGYVVSAKVSPDQAGRVFSALADYCLSE